MVLPWADVVEGRTRAIAEVAIAWGRYGLRWAAARSGLPVIVVAALAGVLTWRVVKRTWHVALELGFALVVLLLATRLGWIRW